MKKIQISNIVMLTVFSVILLSSFSLQIASNVPSYPQTAKSIQPSGYTTMVNWHTGTDKTENGVSITYSQTAQAANPPGTPQDVLYENMNIGFNDGSNSKIEWMNIINFISGGLDIAKNQVIDWNKASSMGIALQYVNDMSFSESVHGMCGFAGFFIMKGNATDVYFAKGNTGNGYDTVILGVTQVAKISFMNATTFIGPVGTSKSGNNTKVVFNVLVNASIVDTGGNRLSIPANITIQIVHTPQRNIVKYGLVLDWSSTPQFPADSQLVPGDHFFLVTSDLMTVAHDINGESRQIVAFTMADNNNDTAMFTDGGVFYGALHFTKNYTIQGTGTFHNTTRIYVLNASTSTYGITSYGSGVFVFFDGFVYGTSTGLSFDPSVEIPYAIVGSSYLLYFVIGGIAAAVVVVVAVLLVHRRKKLRIKS